MLTQVPDYRRFTVAVKLNREEREALRCLVETERLPAAQVVRRLIWNAARGTSAPAPREAVRA
jgi:hypothetical protein